MEPTGEMKLSHVRISRYDLEEADPLTIPIGEALFKGDLAAYIEIDLEWRFAVRSSNREIYIRESLTSLSKLELTNGEIALLDGTAYSSVLIVLASALHEKFNVVAVFDPMMECFVVVATRSKARPLGSIIKSKSIVNCK